RKLGCSAQDARFDPIFTFQLPNFPTSQPGRREGEVIREIAVIGTGTMGRGIAYLSAVAGYDTAIHDVDSSALDSAKAAIESTLKKGVEKGKVAEATAREALQRIHLSTELEPAVRSADLIIEAVPEELDLKM